MTLRRVLIIAALLGAAGCNTIEGYPVHWPWTKDSMLAEKYDVPPQDDARYVNPPTYPKEKITPVIATRETKPGEIPNRMGGGGGPYGGAVGGAGGGPGGGY